MGFAIAQVLGLAGPFVGVFLAVAFVAFGYFLLTLDRSRATSPSKDDTQAGLKLVLYGLVLSGVAMASLGLIGLLSYMLGGFKGGASQIKGALPPIIVGALTILIVAKALLPRTNAATAHQPERYFVGMLGLIYGTTGLVSVDLLMHGLFNDAQWAENANTLSMLVVSGAVALFAIQRFGGLSGWTSPAPAAPPPPQPQYPPQGGGYPPQGGGYPPQGGGYPPQGGGYPPQGGGGYPPQGGGGYPPQGGYGR